MKLIKDLTRIKYLHLREKGESAPLDMCYEVIEEFERERLIDGSSVREGTE